MHDVHKNNDKYNLGEKRKVLIFFDGMIDDMISNNKINPFVTDLLIRGRKLNISLAFITQSYFQVPKDVTLTSTLTLL